MRKLFKNKNNPDALTENELATRAFTIQVFAEEEGQLRLATTIENLIVLQRQYDTGNLSVSAEEALETIDSYHSTIQNLVTAKSLDWPIDEKLFETLQNNLENYTDEELWDLLYAGFVR